MSTPSPRKRQAFRRASVRHKKEARTSYRRPRGIHNKHLICRRKGPMVQPGYRTPRQYRYTLRGKTFALVARIADIEDHKDIILAHVGMRTRLTLLQYAKEKNITVHNHDLDKEITHITDEMSKRKTKQAKAKEKTKAAKPAKETPAQEPKDQKEKDREQAEKLITQAR